MPTINSNSQPTKPTIVDILAGILAGAWPKGATLEAATGEVVHVMAPDLFTIHFTDGTAYEFSKNTSGEK